LPTFHYLRENKLLSSDIFLLAAIENIVSKLSIIPQQIKLFLLKPLIEIHYKTPKQITTATEEIINTSNKLFM